MVTVTVYSTGPSCQRCRLTCRALADRQIGFRLVDITSPGSSQVREFLTTDLGYSEAPVVIVDNEPEHHWSGFRPDLIERLAHHQAAVRATPSLTSAHPLTEGSSWMSTIR